MALATQPASIAARFPSTCTACWKPITVGEAIARIHGATRYGHVGCVDALAAGAVLVKGMTVKSSVPAGLDLSSVPAGDSYHAVENAEGNLTFLRISRPADERWTGWVFVNQYLGGQGVAQRLGSQRPGAAYKGQWSTMLAVVVANPKASAERFAAELGRCYVCGRDLTDSLSRSRGQGPICYEKGL